MSFVEHTMTERERRALASARSQRTLARIVAPIILFVLVPALTYVVWAGGRWFLWVWPPMLALIGLGVYSVGRSMDAVLKESAAHWRSVRRE